MGGVGVGVGETVRVGVGVRRVVQLSLKVLTISGKGVCFNIGGWVSEKGARGCLKECDGACRVEGHGWLVTGGVEWR